MGCKENETCVWTARKKIDWEQTPASLKFSIFITINYNTFRYHVKNGCVYIINIKGFNLMLVTQKRWSFCCVPMPLEEWPPQSVIPVRHWEQVKASTQLVIDGRWTKQETRTCETKGGQQRYHQLRARKHSCIMNLVILGHRAHALRQDLNDSFRLTGKNILERNTRLW